MNSDFTSDVTAVAPASISEPVRRPSAAPGRILGDYVLGPVLGAGGMGIVYQAQHRFSGQHVAIKTLKAITQDAFAHMVREARLMNAISDPDVIDIHEVGLSDDGCPFLVMERLFGFTAADWLKSHERFSEHQLKMIAAPMLRGVSAIHAAKILHRDIKPSNVFICTHTGEITVKVFDLGVSVQRHALPAEDKHRGVGTPAFIAPEVLNGEPFSAASDLYSAALTLYTLLYGENPLKRAKLSNTYEMVRRGHFEPLRGVSNRLNAALLRALSRDPRDRGTLEDLAKQTESNRIRPGRTG